MGLICQNEHWVVCIIQGILRLPARCLMAANAVSRLR